MASRLNRAWVSRATVAAVLALPLLGIGTAKAAIGGANPSSSSARPNALSATALDASDVQVCFDKTLSPTSSVFGTPSNIFLDAYNSIRNYSVPIGATLDAANNKCVDLAFNTHSGTLDLGQFTVAEIGPNAVTSGGQGNLSDSVTVTTSTTHNGTAGLTTGPDLTGPGPQVLGTNSIPFVFDQAIEPGSLTAANQKKFWYQNAQGQFCFASSATFTSSTTILATFPTIPGTACNDIVSGTPTVANARRAGVLGGAVSDVVDLQPVFNAPQGTNMPNAANGGATVLPSLTKGSLDVPSGNKVTYTFDHPINAGTVDATGFYVVLSEGTVLFGTNPNAQVAGSPNSVVVTFPGLQNRDEYAVQAGVIGTAVQTGNPPTTGSDGTNTYTNSPGAVAIGDNAGAFARGFTTGPDAYALTINKTTNVVSLSLDQRVASAPFGTEGFRLLDSAGNSVGSPTSVNIPSFPNPGPVTITFDISAAVSALNPTQLQIDRGALITSLGNSDAESAPQVLTQTGSAAHIKAVKVAKHHKKATKHRTHRRARTHKRA